jgi:hypothetical protein
MDWLKKLLGGEDDNLQRTLAEEQGFDVLDYHRKYPLMDREDAEVLAALNKSIRQVRAQGKRNDILEEEWK